MHEKIIITTDKGEKVEAVAPVVISASRATDIPAFFSKWFSNRLKAGYVVWYNPFNQKPMYVSFKNCKAIIFWTKNPKPIFPYLKELDERGIYYYFQFTLNDYDKENFEINVPPVEKRIETFKKLSEMIGKERIIWRFDPMIVTKEIPPREILRRVWNVGKQLKGYTDKLVFSYIDINGYRKVQNNLVKTTIQFNKDNIEKSEFTNEQKIEIAEGILKIKEHWKNEGWDIELATCCEDIDLSTYGIYHNRCVDGELMKRIFSNDEDFVYYLNYGKFPEKNTLFPLEDQKKLSPEKIKDKGQRKVCGCMISKDIGMYNTCSYFCVYCYANASRDVVIKNRKLFKEDNESIIC